MKAVARDRYGSLDVLQLKDVERPKPGPGEVLVRVRAAGVDPSVWHLTAGRPYLIRLMGFGLRRPKRPVPGLDLAGTIEETGPGVTEFRAGEQVFGTADGSFAEYVTVKTSRVVPMPDRLTFDQAAAVPVSARTAAQAVATVHSGQQVLIIGAGGGVGTYAVQLVKARGAHVTGVCSTAKVDLVKSLGGEGGGKLVGSVARTLRAALLSPFVSQQLKGLMATAERREDLLELRRLIEQDVIAPVLDRTFPLADAVAAIRYVQAGKALGKVVITT
ncbi:NAD(P)-dependent alcohol dehydrogenase [Kutzneria sp. NPDC051319]|uniref:NAD(P)-dependent alcohol dehydrogenase n=1 Tax=Kutzneria sp. NPDC051319 TaxID=3155047 RepID=UPI00341EAFF3